MLLKQGADEGALDRRGRRPIDVICSNSASRSDTDAIRQLLKVGNAIESAAPKRLYRFTPPQHMLSQAWPELFRVGVDTA